MLSFCGTVSAFFVIFLLARRERRSYLLISICSAVVHNLAQLGMASFLVKTNLLPYYAPVLLLSGIGFGLLTGVILKHTTPHLSRILGIFANKA